MENKQINIRYYNEDRSTVFDQTLNVSDAIYEDLYYEMKDYKGGQIAYDSTLYYVLTACSYLWKAEGFQGKPSFDIDLPEIQPTAGSRFS
ncbi:MAG: hypothetical protein IKF80_10410 [Erysipelotrichaceae bacterium]|nr:hypothetical protein [Erysipelotrichaceae bacterium]